MAMSEQELEARRQENIRLRAGDDPQGRPQQAQGATTPRVSSAQAAVALAQALKERALAEREDKIMYDDEIIEARIHFARAESITGHDRRYLIVCTKHGRVYERLMDDPAADWVEKGPPVPRTEARRTYNWLRRAGGDIAEAESMRDE